MGAEYSTIAEVAAKLKPNTIKNKMAAGICKRGVPYPPSTDINLCIIT
jgi:hypothetical protein